MNPLELIPTPYRIIALAVAVLLTFGAIYSLGYSSGSDYVQGKWDAAAIKQSLIAAKAEAESRAKEQSMNRKLEEAQNAATEREAKLRADYAAAHAAALGLRDTIATIRGKLPSNTGQANAATADTALAVFGECAAEIGRVAQFADRHASDAETCRAAWPE